MILFDKICLKDTEKEEKYKVLFEIIMHEASVGDSFVLIILRYEASAGYFRILGRFFFIRIIETNRKIPEYLERIYI